MIYLPIEQQYDKRNQVFHSSAFAIAAGVVGVAGAATAAGMSMSAASRAAKAQGAASKAMQKRTNKATKTFNKQQAQLREQVAAIDPTIRIPEFNLANATTEGIEQANRITANTIQQLNKIDPQSAGAIERAYSTLAQGQNLAAQLMAEGAPQESRQAVLRQLAETGGAGFNIGAAGRGMAVPSAPQASYARALGGQDIQYRLMGAELGQSLGNTAFNWRNFSAAFIQSPTQMMQLGLQGRGQNIDVAQANIRNRMAQAEMISGLNLGQYQAATGQAQRLYGLQQENIQTALARDQATAQGVQGITSATAGALGGIGSAYGQLAAAGGGLGGFQYGKTKIGAGGGSVGGMGTYGPNYGLPT